MAYIDIQSRGNKKYYYLAHTLRIDNAFRKIRVFLGVNLSKNELESKANARKKLLNQRISAIEKAEKAPFEMNIGFSRRILSKQQLGKLEAVKRKYHKQIKLADKDILRKVRESFLIKYTFDTNSAEGNTISLKETELILKKGIVPKSHSLREIYEIENTVKAYESIESYKGILDHKFILRLHRLVVQNTLQNSRNEGRYRIKGQNVMMQGSKHFPPKGGRQIKRLTGDLIEDYSKCRLSRAEAAILFHSAFIAIHPFIDGNGRVSRLIFNWMLMRDGIPPIDFPSESHIEFTDMMEMSRDGDSVPLANYLFDRILGSSLYVHKI